MMERFSVLIVILSGVLSVHHTSALEIKDVDLEQAEIHVPLASSILIPCSFNTSNPAELPKYIFMEWTFTPEDSNVSRPIIMLYTTMREQVMAPNNRVQAFKDAVVTGNCSIFIDNTDLNDSGTYQVFLAVNDVPFNKSLQVRLKVFDEEQPETITRDNIEVSTEQPETITRDNIEVSTEQPETTTRDNIEVSTEQPETITRYNIEPKNIRPKELSTRQPDYVDDEDEDLVSAPQTYNTLEDSGLLYVILAAGGLLIFIILGVSVCAVCLRCEYFKLKTQMKDRMLRMEEGCQASDEEESSSASQSDSSTEDSTF